MIYVCQPYLDEQETKFVSDAVSKGAISGLFGEYLHRFEEEFSTFCHCDHGVAVTSGTTALHLALAVLKIGPGDEVLVPTYTNMATFFAVIYQGAKPIPVDVEADTWNLDVSKVEALITPKTKAIIPVHIFGHPVDMDPLMAIAKKYNLAVVEDCAQAHGAEYNGQRVGSFGDIGCFSFYGNKIITTGEGGMLVTNSKAYADRAASLKSLAFGKENKFLHTEIGFNFRMTNVQAAIGCAQMGKINHIIQRKRELASWYTERLENCSLLNLPVERDNVKSVGWMYHIVLSKDCALSRSDIMAQLADSEIETREGFIPFNQQKNLSFDVGPEDSCPIANHIGANSFYLPSGAELTRANIDTVCDKLLEILK
jgi:perosamine synthetase